MVKWDDLLKAKTSVELFILLGDAFSNLSGSPEIKIDGTGEGDKRGLQMEVLQSITVHHEDGNYLCRPITQEFILLQDGTLSWEMKLTGEKISGLADIQTRLRQVMEDGHDPLMFVEESDSPEIRKTTGVVPIRGEERVLIGYVPNSTKPTLEWIIPWQQDNLSKKETG